MSRLTASQVRRPTQFCTPAVYIQVKFRSRIFYVLFIGIFRSKWPIGLPQPPAHRHIRAPSVRILNAKSVIPDGAVFVPEKYIQKLSFAAESAFKRLKRSELTGNAARGEESFACQSTPSVQLPRTSGFQFASSFWEDKKPVHSMLDDAYRQNRMATAAAVRHLHSLHVKAPVFGLVWSDGSVRAHVDWCVNKGQEPPVCTMSTFLKKGSRLTHCCIIDRSFRSVPRPARWQWRRGREPRARMEPG